MPETNIFDFYNKEIDEANEILARQHSQIKWYVQIYLLALFGFFSLAGFLFKKDATSQGCSSEDVIILACATIIFCLGWLLLSALAHKISIINLIYKQLAYMRRNRLEHVNIFTSKNYIYPLDPKEIRLPGLVSYMPYLFFVLNYNVICGCVFFITYKYFSLANAVNISVCSAIFIGLFYPRVCVTFNKHMRASADADSFPNKQYLEQKWEEKRKGKINLIGFTIKYGMLILIFSVSILATIFNIYNIETFSPKTYLSTVILSGLLFGILRYFFEVVDLKINLSLRKTA